MDLARSWKNRASRSEPSLYVKITEEGLSVEKVSQLTASLAVRQAASVDWVKKDRVTTTVAARKEKRLRREDCMVFQSVADVCCWQELCG